MSPARQQPSPNTPGPAGPIIAACSDPFDQRDLLKVAARLSVDLNLPLVTSTSQGRAYAMLLVAMSRRLEIRQVKGKGRPFFVDLGKLDITSGAGRSLRQPLARALGLKRRSDAAPVVIDGTAGWGEDTWLLAALGCHVLAVERNKVVATLLRDGLLRAAVSRPDVLGRIFLVTADAVHLLRRLRLREADDDLSPQMQQFFHPDVVYLDPMFPSGRKTAQRKAMTVLHQLVGEDDDAQELFEAAMGVARRRVVVKRSTRCKPLAADPVHTHEGKGVRYDVYPVDQAVATKHPR